MSVFRVAILGLSFAGFVCAQDSGRFLIPVECMHPEQGRCFIASMDFGEEGDKFTGNRSGLQVFEDGKPLGPARAIHAAIREHGGGLFSHWTRESLYFSSSDGTDPRANGRRYEVASTNPRSTLGGAARLPARTREHIERISSPRHEYSIVMGGTLDMENTRTLTSNNCYITFQNNLELVIENVGDRPVVNPRLVMNDRGNWYTFDDLLAEFTRGAKTDQERAMLIWQNMRQNLYHETPLFGDAEPHDPVKLFNVYGFNLCDDAGNAGCSLFYHAGMTGSKNRALNGHVQCEAFVDGGFQFLDVDMDCFYLDRENERPISGDRCAHDQDLVRRELNYGPMVSAFTSSDAPAALFGPDDRRYDARYRGHEIGYTLRPRERAVFRWDNLGKYCAENEQRRHRPKYFGNSKFIFTPQLTLDRVETDAHAWQNLLATEQGLASQAGGAQLTYEIAVPYAICGGTVRAEFGKPQPAATVALSLDGKQWRTVEPQQDGDAQIAEYPLDAALDLYNKPAKYRYLVRIAWGTDGKDDPSVLRRLELETDVLAAPASLPRLAVGVNAVRYWDQTEGNHQVQITHRWRETDAVQPLPPPTAPDYPRPDVQVRDSVLTYLWPEVDGADQYHLQVSRRADFAYPYRTSLDVIIPGNRWSVPYTGIYSPGTTYYWRLRCRDHWGVWGPWSEPWTFTWAGPCVPVDLRFDQQGTEITLHWAPHARGERAVTYEVYGSDQRGFSVHKEPHDVPGRGRVPGNYLGTTTGTQMIVVSGDQDAEAANRVFYRVVAIDSHGTQSGCSDYVELPHPFVYSNPASTAVVGKKYEYQVRSLRSLGDYQCRQDPASNQQAYAYRFWDIEQPRFKLLQGPDWLSLDEATGRLTGTAEAGNVGQAAVVLEVTDQFHGQTTQAFDLQVQSR